MIIFSTVVPYFEDFNKEKYNFKMLNMGSYYEAEPLNVFPTVRFNPITDRKNFDDDFINFYNYHVLNNQEVLQDIIAKVLIPHMSGDKVIILIPSCEVLIVNIMIDFLYRMYGIDSYMASCDEELYKILYDNIENHVDFEGSMNIESDVNTLLCQMGVEHCRIQHIIF